jgi:hypothetical protein
MSSSDDPSPAEEQETVLPTSPSASRSTATRRVRLAGLEAVGHETSPPALQKRLIKELNGSASAAVDVCRTDDRHHRAPGLCFASKARCRTTAFAVTQLRGILETSSTSVQRMEDLDQISRGEREWLDFITVLSRRRHLPRAGRSPVKQAQETASIR